MNIVYTTWLHSMRGVMGICVTRDEDDMPRAFITQIEYNNDEQTDKEYVVKHGAKLYGSTLDKIEEAFENKTPFDYLFNTIKGDVCLVMYKDNITEQMKSYISPVMNINANDGMNETVQFGAKFTLSTLNELQHHMKHN